ncbi:MAG: hypothetical protein Fur0010_23470 [Bdellovibrio sp.]
MDLFVSFDFNSVWAFGGIVFLASMFGLFTLVQIAQSKFIWLRKYLTIPARKSTTNAVQLGGLPISLVIFLSSLYLGYENVYFNGLNSEILHRWSYCSLVIIAYGYLDDRFELRPIVKLCLQVLCVLTFSVLTAEIFSRYQSALSLIVVFIWGMGTVNGANLLDGLDTLTVKLTTSILSFYFIASFYLHLPQLTWAATMVLSAILGFYYFNKEPAKVHLGEIGGSFMGMSYLLLSSLLYVGTREKFGAASSAAIALMPLSLPMVELAISFMRRIYNRKSPFKGDKLHVHHILKNYHNFSASQSSSIMMLGHLFSLSLSSVIAFVIHPWLGYFSHLIILTSMYLSIGVKYWKGSDTLDLSAKSIFQYLRKKDVMIIDSSKIDDFQITIINEEVEEDDDDQEVA